MSAKLKTINDPENPTSKKVEMPSDLNLRDIQTYKKTIGKDGKPIITKVNVPEENISSAKSVTISGFPKKINCQEIFNRVVEGIEHKIVRKTYFIGKDKNQIFCGTTLQVIPIEGFSQITSGHSIYSVKPPLENNKFKFEKSHQLVLRVGHEIGSDYVVVVGSNGCVLLESGSCGLLDSPIFIVEPTGNYYHIKHGQRVLVLGPGRHMVLHTKEANILLVRIKTSEKIKVFKTDSKGSSDSNPSTDSKIESKSGDKKVEQKSKTNSSQKQTQDKKALIAKTSDKMKENIKVIPLSTKQEIQKSKQISDQKSNDKPITEKLNIGEESKQSGIGLKPEKSHDKELKKPPQPTLKLPQEPIDEPINQPIVEPLPEPIPETTPEPTAVEAQEPQRTHPRNYLNCVLVGVLVIAALVSTVILYYYIKH